MQFLQLSEDQRKIVEFITDWSNDMTGIYGFCVFDKEGQSMPWMQALCRGLYGENWGEYMAENGITMPDESAVEMAKEWAAGNLPEWLVIDVNSETKNNVIIFEDKLGEKVED